MIINFKNYFAKALPYSQYMQHFEQAIQQNNPLPEAEQVTYFKYYALNLQRSQRIYNQYEVTGDLLAAVDALQRPLHWLVITEPWCGDSAQNLPIIAKVADASQGKIQLHLVYRDENPELIDQFLTNGGRSIPKLIQFNHDFDLTGTWGPRPEAAQALVIQLKAANVPHDEYIATVHKWYAENKGHDVSQELLRLINTK